MKYDISCFLFFIVLCRILYFLKSAFDANFESGNINTVTTTDSIIILLLQNLILAADGFISELRV